MHRLAKVYRAHVIVIYRVFMALGLSCVLASDFLRFCCLHLVLSTAMARQAVAVVSL